MDAFVQAELSKLDPAVPFRAIPNHLHHTWARTFHSTPELFIKPESEAELQKVVTLARRCRRRLVAVGCGHSPSDLTCTSSWMVNLDNYSKILNIDRDTKLVRMQAGIRLWKLNDELAKEGLTMPNLGSIDDQSIAGAMSTATHGSSLKHGTIPQSIREITLLLANGHFVRCSATSNVELFRAALVSLGTLGIITEVVFQAVPDFKIEWHQTLVDLSEVTGRWNRDLWTQSEFVRVWYLPYMQRAILWRAEKTDKPLRPETSNWYGGSVGFHTYHWLLWMAQYIPRLLPSIEWFVFGMQYGWRPGTTATAVQPGRKGLLMNCLYSQFVDEWAIPLSKGPEALLRITAWLKGDTRTAGIPFDSSGLWVHSPIEVRVCDSSQFDGPRPYMDNTIADGPTLYLNATLYRPYNHDPPCKYRYYEAFEWLMKELGGKPHWAKNTQSVTRQEYHGMYGSDMQSFLKVRNEVDPDGMFVGAWHRRNLLFEEGEEGGEKDGASSGGSVLPLEEQMRMMHANKDGGLNWEGEMAAEKWPARPMSSDSSGEDGGRRGSETSTSAESFDLMAKGEASVYHDKNDDGDDEL